MHYHLLICFFIILTGGGLNAQEADVHGTIRDTDGEPLIGATVRVVGSVIAAATDVEGKFELGVPPGRVRLLATYIGFQNFDTLFRVGINDRRIDLDITMLTAIAEGPEVIVFGRRNVGQAQALRQQQSALTQQNIVHAELFNKYPDVTLSETVRRLPGVTISQDGGEGQQAQVRGLPGQYTTILLNGQRLPSVQPSSDRAGNLELIQSNLVEEVRVIKSRSANLDGDAIGGTVDFRLRQGEERFEVLVQAGGGRSFGFDNPGQTNGITQLAGVLNSEIRDESLYALFAGSYFQRGYGYQTERYNYQAAGRENYFDAAPFDTDRNSQQLNLVGAIELRPSIYNRARLSYNFSRNSEDYVRRSARFSAGDDNLYRRRADWTETRDLNMVTLEVENNFEKTRLDYDLSFASTNAGTGTRTQARGVSFGLMEPPPGNGTVATNRITNQGYQLVNPAIDEVILDEDIAIGSVNLTRYVNETKTSFLRAGARYRIKDRQQQFRALESNIFPGTMGRLDPGSFPDRPDDVGDLDADPAVPFTRADNRENVIAGYLMYAANWSGRFSTSAGLRYEYTDNTFGENLEEDEDGSFDYDNLFPSLNLTYRIRRDRQLRLSFYEAIARPAYGNFFPGEQRQISFRRFLVGNFGLEPTTSRNIDLSFERYGRRDGFIELSFYGKFLDQPTIPFTAYRSTSFGEDLTTNIRNLDRANLFGAELGFYQNLGFVDPFLRFINVNGTYNYNAFNLRTEGPLDGLPVSNAPRQSANLSFVYANPNKRLNVVLAGTFRDRVLSELLFEQPVYLNNNVSLDLSADIRLVKNFSIYARLNNLTDHRFEEWIGEPEAEGSRLRSTTNFGRWGVVGLRWDVRGARE